MKASAQATRDAVQQNGAVRVKSRLIAEWEYNRFYVPTVTVTPALPTDDEWLSIVDLNSVALPARPKAGVAKARANSLVQPLGPFRDKPNQARFYPADQDDVYKYWTSYATCQATLTSGAYNFTSPITVTVMYPQTVAMNKVVVGFETSYAAPSSYSIEYTPNGTNWNLLSSAPGLDADGSKTLWHAASGWGTTKDYDNPVVIKGIRINVYSMNKPSAHLDLIQLGGRLENDLSDYLVSYSSSMEVSSRSFIAPLGKASSNTGEIVLSNIDRRFNTNNTNSLYYGLIDKKVRFTLDTGIGSGSPTVYEYLREFTMWADNWGGQDKSTVTVSLKDSSAILQEMSMPQIFLEDSTIGGIIWQVMDRVGLSNYQYTKSDFDFGQIVPFYWPQDTSTTVWDEFSNMAEGTQTAVYFDEYDVMQIKARKAMYSKNASISWNLDAVQNGVKLPDIITVEVGDSSEVNSVDIKYKPAHYSDFNNGFPKMETSWEPKDETVVLRASSLTASITSGSTWLTIRQDETSFWPYAATVNIEGEILRYDGKEYMYYTTGGVINRKVIKTLDEKNTLDTSSDQFYVWKNSFTGNLAIAERGMNGSIAVDHKVIGQNSNYPGSKVCRLDGQPWFLWQGMINRDVKNGLMRLTPYPGGDLSTLNMIQHVQPVQGNRAHYGTRVRFPSGQGSNKSAGLYFAGWESDAGFYIDITTTEWVENVENRVWRNEICFLRKAEGQAVGVPNKGYQVNILEDTWYDLDVTYVNNTATSTQSVIVYLNGVNVGGWDVVGTDRPWTTNRGYFGAWVRGQTIAEFEYLYAVRDDGADFSPDNSTFLDLKTGSSTSGFIQRDWVYQTGANYSTFYGILGWGYYSTRNLQTNSVFDEFGPIVHEIRDFDVKFDEDACPAAHSNLYFSNTSQVVCTNYDSDAFGATFTLANTSRTNAIVKGDDTITFGADNSVTQSLLIYGRLVYQDEEVSLKKTDDLAVRRRGVTLTEFSSPYLQTKETAEELGDWVVSLWGSGAEELTVEVFGNPFLQLGDLVTINFPVKGMLPATHKYFVVQKKNEGGTGYKSSLTLRRANI